MLANLVFAGPAVSFPKYLLYIDFEWRCKALVHRIRQVFISVLSLLLCLLFIASYWSLLGLGFLPVKWKNTSRDFFVCVWKQNLIVHVKHCYSSRHIIIHNKNVAKYYSWLRLIMIGICLFKSNNAPLTFKCSCYNLCNVKYYPI